MRPGQAVARILTSIQLSVTLLEFAPADEKVSSLCLRLGVGRGALTIVCVYLPHISSKYSAFLEKLNRVLYGASVGLHSPTGGLNAHMDNDGLTWSGEIGRDSLPNPNTSGVLLLDFCASQGLSIITPCLNKRKCTCYQRTIGQRLMIFSSYHLM